ncbi:hypothetical protein [Lewinella sp. W8]|uniref:hypothetical protein n=1 Tax=Lewinella sp. W8 TaxID=2528208 RepID=UPI0010685550|nr:hypothetical protein [Lewinella sp. W8]MTB51280.1 hypothetical protein [Lewinella sp. W8]
MRYGIFLLALWMLGCGNETAAVEDPTGTAPVEEMVDDEIIPAPIPAEVEGEDDLDVEAAIEEIRGAYQQIEQWKAGGMLKKDSISFRCDEGVEGGSVVLYRRGTQTVLVEYSLYQGDHGGGVEYWYLRDGRPVFVFGESSYWHFGGPQSELEDGSLVSGTRDVVTEERFYVREGKVIRALTKEYEILSWADEPTDPDNVPNQLLETDGELPAAWDFVSEVIQTGKADCDLVG